MQLSISQPRFTVLGDSGRTAAAAAKRSTYPETRANQYQGPEDHFKEADGIRFAGTHLIVDMWGASHLDDEARLRRAMLDAVDAAGATLLHLHLHLFTPYDGITGVAVLAESHISVHTWPEKGYAAFDIFMCGDAEPQRAADVLVAALKPARSEFRELRRGVEEAAQ
jgi:S-adenosylmethionine decarboxylase